MDLQLLGVDHREAPLDLRERLALDAHHARALLGQGVAEGVWREALILSTCNRTEVYAFSSDRASFEGFVRSGFLSRGASHEALEKTIRGTSGEGAVRHLCRVACGLESRILGEVEILGQVKEALALSRAAGSWGPQIDRLVVTAVQAGRRGRSETALSKGALSVASAAVSLAKKNTGGLANRRILILGAGETGRLLALHVADKHAEELLIANRTAERAEALAAEVRGRAIGLDEVGAALDTVDVVLAAVQAPVPLLTVEALESTRKTRRGRRLLVIDVSVPRSVEPAVAGLEGIDLVTIDDVGEVVARNQSLREAEVQKVEDIVEHECVRFRTWAETYRRTPVERQLRAQFEAIRKAEVSRYLVRFQEGDRRDVERLTRSLVNRLLHTPTVRLRETDPGSENGLARLQAVQELFGLRAATEDTLG